jgi:outer membrane lipoprotein SlyB
MQKLAITLPIIVASALLGACATTGSGYSRNDLHAIGSVQYGVIESVRSVNVNGTQSGLGAGAGAVWAESQAARSATGQEASQGPWWVRLLVVSAETISKTAPPALMTMRS